VNKKQLKVIVKKTLPEPTQGWLKAQWQIYKHSPPVGMVNWGNLRRLQPINRRWNARGLPIDRYYIENFLERHSHDIQGRVLEIGERSYTQKYGGDRITKSDVLHVQEGNSEATFIGDLAQADHIPSSAFDCFILTQTLQYLYDVRSALRTIYRILKPGGIVLATLPNITPLIDPNWNDRWYWNFTTLSAERLFEEVFPSTNVQVEVFGNVMAATAFLQGLSTQELKKEELDYCDSGYQVLITVRAVKPEEQR
jgi:SAM-dependent methyltransferase